MARTITKWTIDEMMAEIKRRNRVLSKLNRKRNSLLKKLAGVEAEISNHGGKVGGTSVRVAGSSGIKRPRNEVSLVEAIAATLSKDKPMTAADIEKAVTKNGYKSGSASFKTIIFQALGKDKRFKKIARGQYVLK